MAATRTRSAKAKTAAKAKANARVEAGAKKAAKSQPEDTARLNFVEVDEAPQFYTNHVEVSHNMHEFEMIFGRAPSRITPEEREAVRATGRINVEALVRIIIPPSLLQDFINVLGTQKDKYQENVGPLPGVKPKE